MSQNKKAIPNGIALYNKLVKDLNIDTVGKSRFSMTLAISLGCRAGADGNSQYSQTAKQKKHSFHE
jgi:hypothetical protein